MDLSRSDAGEANDMGLCTVDKVAGHWSLSAFSRAPHLEMAIGLDPTPCKRARNSAAETLEITIEQSLLFLRRDKHLVWIGISDEL